MEFFLKFEKQQRVWLPMFFVTNFLTGCVGFASAFPVSVEIDERGNIKAGISHIGVGIGGPGLIGFDCSSVCVQNPQANSTCAKHQEWIDKFCGKKDPSTKERQGQKNDIN